MPGLILFCRRSSLNCSLLIHAVLVLFWVRCGNYYASEIMIINLPNNSRTLLKGGHLQISRQTEQGNAAWQTVLCEVILNFEEKMVTQ